MKTTTGINTGKFIIEQSDYDTENFIAVKEVDVPKWQYGAAVC